MLFKSTIIGMKRIKNRLNTYISFCIKNLHNPQFILSSLRTEFPFIFPESSTPPMVTLEISNKCNIKCEYCFRRNDPRKDGLMPYNQIIGIFDEIKALNIPKIRFMGNGEPTLHPDIHNILDYASNSAKIIDFKTNGLALTKKLCHTLVNTVTRINISVEGYLPEHIEKGRVGMSYEKVIRNLTLLNNIRNESNSKSAIILNVMFRPSMINKRDEMLNFWKPYGDHILFHHLRSTGKIDDGKDLFDIIACSDDNSRYRCGIPLKTLDILYDGTFSFCCYMTLKKDSSIRYLGNLSEMSIYEAWNHPRMKELRNGQRKNDSLKTPHCNGCNGPVLNKG